MDLRRTTLVLTIGLALAVGGCGKEDDAGPDRSEEPSPTLAVAADEAWCAGWQDLVATQAQYVAAPTPEAADALLAAVGALRELGVPESLDPAGYTELTAVLDDVRASADPSFSPSVFPSEPADVHHPEEAPFGAWLAEYCAT